MKRRIMYFHHIVKRKENELIKKVYKAQKLNPCKGDWINLLNEDEKILKIKLNEDEVKKLSKYKFKKLIDKAILEAAFEFLMKKKEKRSKIEPLSYNKLGIQSYIKMSNNLKDEEKITLFKLRVREIDVKANYKNKYNNLKCDLCNSPSDEEDQYHLLQCDRLINECESLAANVGRRSKTNFPKRTKFDCVLIVLLCFK